MVSGWRRMATGAMWKSNPKSSADSHEQWHNFYESVVFVADVVSIEKVVVACARLVTFSKQRDIRRWGDWSVSRELGSMASAFWTSSSIEYVVLWRSLLQGSRQQDAFRGQAKRM
jgi:hypothetical protein